MNEQTQKLSIKMNREILFRGKNIYKQWLEGYYLRCSEGKHYIFALGDTVTYAARNQVDPATVGQFTGLYDANKKRIFEGDVVKACETIYKVVFRDGMFELSQGAEGIIEDTFVSFWQVQEKEVLGNIHDNPELMEVKDIA